VFDHERDRGLVERHQAGDAAAFSELYAIHFSGLVRFCRRRVRDPHLAEEIAQDAFLRAYRSLPRFAGERRFYPWLTVIARRLIIDDMRRSARLRLEADLDGGVAAAAEDLVVQRLDSDDLVAALDRVRDRHREVLHLRDWEGLSYEAIAKRLDIPVTTVPPLLHRARAAFKREYLAVTEAERIAALPGLLGTVLLAGRRLRDKLSQYAAWLPEPAAFTAPIAGTALGMMTILTPAVGESAASPASTWQSHESEAAQEQGKAGTVATSTTSPGSARQHWGETRRDEDSARPEVFQHAPMVVIGDPGKARERQERSRQEDPIYIEFEGHWIGWDPARDADYTRNLLETAATPQD
jgi:RNA polymerase sigma-70 factor (ECF subfamily)